MQAEQSLGLGIMPFFNKHSISLTRFIRIMPKKFPRPGSKMPPPVLVLHSRYAPVHLHTHPYPCFTHPCPWLHTLALTCLYFTCLCLPLFAFNCACLLSLVLAFACFHLHLHPQPCILAPNLTPEVSHILHQETRLEQGGADTKPSMSAIGTGAVLCTFDIA